MLSRQAKSSKSKDVESKSSSASTSKSQSQASLSTPISQSSSKLTRGEKRKATDGDPHDKQGSEYLRRKHNFIKASIRVDYQPDICKDYKETGFCGFGDSCKFLHDRSDYKHGWQLEQEWAKGEFKDEDEDKYLIKEEDDEDGGNDDDKNKCNVCKEFYKDPIVTKCKHYFCSACADKECVDKCFICEKPTSGIFKVAKLDFLTKR